VRLALNGATIMPSPIEDDIDIAAECGFAALEIWAAKLDAHVQRGDDPSAQTDSSGAFEARGVRPGHVEVVATHPAFVSGRASDVDVDLEKEPPSVRIVLTRGGGSFATLACGHDPASRSRPQAAACSIAAS